MASSTAQAPAKPFRTLAITALPWLFSTTTHILLMLVLAVFLRLHQSASQPGLETEGIEVTLLPSTGEASGESGEGDTVNLPSSDGSYYDDEPSPSPNAAAPRGAAPTGSATLRSLLNEQPQINLAGVLPTEGLAGGVLEGGVGSAQGLTSHPPAASGLRGGYARTSVFGLGGEGHKFVYVFDRSGSMDGHGGAPLSAAKAELINSLKHLGKTHQFQIIFYNDHPRVFNPTGRSGALVFGTDQNKYLAQKFVGSITADGATRHEEPLEMAMRMAPDVIFLTDADEPRMTSQQLARLAHMNPGAAINAIEFGYGSQSDDDNFLVKLARQNGGKHVYIDVSKLSAVRR